MSGKTPLRSSALSPIPLSNNHQLLRTSGLRTLDSKRNSIFSHKSRGDRSSISKSLARPSRASSVVESQTPVKLSILTSGQDNVGRTSNESPDWFKIPVPECRQNNDDGKISVLSKLNGWIFVSENSKSRKNRMGKLGPFEQGNFDVHKVSALAPAWMNKNKEIEVEAKSRDLSPAYSAMNKEQKRMFLFEGEGKVELGKIVDRTPKAEPFEEIKLEKIINV